MYYEQPGGGYMDAEGNQINFLPETFNYTSLQGQETTYAPPITEAAFASQGYNLIPQDQAVAALQDPTKSAYVNQYTYENSPTGNAGSYLDTQRLAYDQTMDAWSSYSMEDGTGALAQYFGMTPYEFNNWKTQYNMSHYGNPSTDTSGPGSNYFAITPMMQQLATERGFAGDASVQQMLQQMQANFQAKGEVEQQRDAAGDGLGTFLTLLAAAVGGGAFLAGGLGAGASSTALGAGAGGVVDLGAMGGIAGGGFGTLGAGGAASGLGTALAGGGAMDLAGIGAAMDSSVVGSAVPGFDLAGAGMYPLSGGAGAITSAPTFTTGGATGGFGGTGGTSSGSFLDQIKNLYSQMPPGSSNLLKAFGGGGTGSGATGGQTGGTSGMGNIMDWLSGTGTGSLGGLATGIMQYGEYDDQSDFLKNTMERAISASDPYGYGPYRQYAADQLQKTYTDPLSIYNSAEMQGLDKAFMDKTMAEQAASGNLFNAPERVAQRQNNFYSNLKDYRQPLMQMSGSQFRPDTKAYYEFAGPIVANELSKSASLGGAISSGMGGIQSLLGLGGSGSTGGTTGTSGGSLTDLLSLWGGSGGGSSTPSDWGLGTFWDYLSGGSTNTGAVDSFYGASDLVDLFL